MSLSASPAKPPPKNGRRVHDVLASLHPVCHYMSVMVFPDMVSQPLQCASIWPTEVNVTSIGCHGDAAASNDVVALSCVRTQEQCLIHSTAEDSAKCSTDVPPPLSPLTAALVARWHRAACVWTRATGCRDAPWRSGWWRPATRRRESATATQAALSAAPRVPAASARADGRSRTAAWAAPTTGSPLKAHT